MYSSIIYEFIYATAIYQEIQEIRLANSCFGLTYVLYFCSFIFPAFWWKGPREVPDIDQTVSTSLLTLYCTTS